jgi:hypothetical protein
MKGTKANDTIDLTSFSNNEAVVLVCYVRCSRPRLGRENVIVIADVAIEQSVNKSTDFCVLEQTKIFNVACMLCSIWFTGSGPKTTESRTPRRDPHVAMDLSGDRQNTVS